MFFPDLPDVLGIPAIPRIPPVIYSQVSRGLDSASGILNSASIFAAVNPHAQMQSVLPDITNASSIMDTVIGTLGNYPSTLFNQFSSPLGGISGTLGSIISTINGSPTGPLSTISSNLNGVSDDLAGSALDFAAGTADITGTPSVDSAVTETVTVQGTTLEWGIIKDGAAVIKGDNFISLEYKQDWVIADYPVEDGGFETYDKVSMPFDARVTVSCGGSVGKRATFYNSIKEIAGDLNLYDIAMPEETLQGVNVAHIDFKRTNIQGVGLLVACIYLIEVRSNAEIAFTATPSTPASPTDTKSPAGAGIKNGGTVQPVPAIPTQQKLIDTAINALVPGL